MKKKVKRKRSTKKYFYLKKLKIPIKGRLDYKSKEWKALKAHCEKRDGGKRCIKSNQDCYGSIHLHHKKSLKAGGTNRPVNLAWICHVHHCLEHPFMIKLLIKQTERRRL